MEVEDASLFSSKLTEDLDRRHSKMSSLKAAFVEWLHCPLYCENEATGFLFFNDWLSITDRTVHYRWSVAGTGATQPSTNEKSSCTISL